LNVEIRAETPDDIAAIRKVNLVAFGRSGEADLVDRLREIDSTLSFVAVKAGLVVGHLCFSWVAIEGHCAANQFALGLAPVAVLPEYQRQGIGTGLIQYGLAECTQLGYKAVVVLGSPAYYPRFGFSPAKAKGLSCEYPVPDEAFMVLELEGNALDGCSGLVKYRSEFNDV
jgi:putative acetyltransferase